MWYNKKVFQTLLFCSALCFSANAFAEDTEENDAALDAGTEEEVEIAAEAISDEEQADEELTKQVRHQIRTRLRLHAADTAAGVCQASPDKATCRAQLKKQIRECYAEAKKQGAINSSEDAASIGAAMLMLAKGKDESIEEAGNMIKKQVKNQWKAKESETAASSVNQMRHRHRFQKQARQVLKECVEQETCSPEQARISLQVMQQASGRADLDARDVGRSIKTELKQNKQQLQSQKRQRNQKQAKAGEQGAKLQQRLMKRLRLHAGENATMAGQGQGEQKRNRYRHGMDGEGRRGGHFGGKDSCGAGAGIGQSGSGTGGGKKGGK